MIRSELKPKLGPKDCAGCGKPFMPINSMHQVHFKWSCIQKKLAKDKRAERENLKARKEAIKTRNELKSEAQDAFNDYIRERDKNQPCISCGATNPPMTSGGQWDAGHFKSRGAYPELAFDEDNCHRQCKSCNGGSGKFAHKERTTSEKYEANLIERIGLARVEALKAPRPLPKLTGDDYREKRATYRAKLKELLKD